MTGGLRNGNKGENCGMKLSVSNIAWTKEQDRIVYDRMRALGFTGLEIAPTRIFPEAPYEHLTEAAKWADALQKEEGFEVPSMQSIWYGRNEQLFGNPAEREALLDYTKKGISFAVAIGCGNLVFGCPRNRNIPEEKLVCRAQLEEEAVSFFRAIGDEAHRQGTVIGMEANPAMYHTNFINDTQSALALIAAVDSKGFRLNLDLGTMLQNEEPLSLLEGNMHLVNHVHISEPGLAPVEKRSLHRDLARVLSAEGYQGFVSIEMGRQPEVSVLFDCMEYVADTFAK